jgi:hypothetical protein
LIGTPTILAAIGLIRAVRLIAVLVLVGALLAALLGGARQSADPHHRHYEHNRR